MEAFLKQERRQVAGGDGGRGGAGDSVHGMGAQRAEQQWYLKVCVCGCVCVCVCVCVFSIHAS